MSNNTLLILIVAVVIVGFVFWLIARSKNTEALRDHYGDEYDRTVEARGGVGKAERDLGIRYAPLRTALAEAVAEIRAA